jgi:hypothetical protein
MLRLTPALLAVPLVLLALVGCSTSAPSAKASVKPCSAAQVNTYIDNIDPSTISRTGAFPEPKLLAAGTSVVCAGNYATTDIKAFRSRSSMAVVAGGATVFAALTKQLEAAGYPKVQLSGMSTHGWNDGKTQIYANLLKDQVGVKALPLFGTGKDLVMIVSWPANDPANN